jgi:hypothetical protein
MFGAIASAAEGKRYFVDATSGNDSNSGLTSALAWKTISKVSAATFAAGNKVLFKRGETWQERLTVPSSGSDGKHIIFGAYGSGALPKIDSPGTVASADLLIEGFEGTGYENTWSETVGSGSIVNENYTGIKLSGSQALRCVSTTANAYAYHELSAQASASYTKVNFYVDAMAGEEAIIQVYDSSWNVVWSARFNGDSDPSTIEVFLYNNGAEVSLGTANCAKDVWHSIEVKYNNTDNTYAWRLNGTQQSAGTLTGTHYDGIYTIEVGIAPYWGSGGTVIYDEVLIDSSDWPTSGSSQTFGSLITATGKDFITIRDIEITGSIDSTESRSGYGIQTDDCDSWIVSNVSVIDCNAAGMIFYGGGDVQVTNCIVDGCNAGGSTTWHEALSLEDVNGFLVQGCTITNNGKEGITVKYNARNGQIINNVSYGNTRMGIYIDSANNVECAKNLVHSSTDIYKCGIGLSLEEVYNPSQDNLYNIDVHHNIIYGCGGGLWVWLEDGAELWANLSGIVIANNTITDNNTHNMGGIYLFGAGSSSNFSTGNKIVNNILFDNTDIGGAKCIRDDASYAAGFTISHNLFGTGESSDTLGTNYVQDDPDFVNAGSRNYALQSASPCINAGTDVGLTTDYAGNPIVGNPDIGAYEYQP